MKSRGTEQRISISDYKLTIYVFETNGTITHLAKSEILSTKSETISNAKLPKLKTVFRTLEFGRLDLFRI